MFAHIWRRQNATFKYLWIPMKYSALGNRTNKGLDSLTPSKSDGFDPYYTFLLDLSYGENTIDNIHDRVLYVLFDTRCPHFLWAMKQIKRSNYYLGHYFVDSEGVLKCMVRFKFHSETEWGLFLDSKIDEIYENKQFLFELNHVRKDYVQSKNSVNGEIIFQKEFDIITGKRNFEGKLDIRNEIISTAII